MAVNDSTFSVTGYVASEPNPGVTRTGVPTMTMRLAWTPRKFDSGKGEWTDEASCFVTVKAWRNLAENACLCLRKGMPVLVSGTLRIRDYQAKDGSRRTAVDIYANAIGHDLSRGVAVFRKVRPPAEDQPAEDQAAEGTIGEHQPPGSVPDTAEDQPPGHEAAHDDVDMAEEILDEATEEPVAAPS